MSSYESENINYYFGMIGITVRLWSLLQTETNQNETFFSFRFGFDIIYACLCVCTVNCRLH